MYEYFIIIIINAFQYYRISDKLKTEELETSGVLSMLHFKPFRVMETINLQRNDLSQIH